MDTVSNQPTQNDEFLTVHEAAKLLKTSPETLYVYLSKTGSRNGKPRKGLPRHVYVKIGRKVLFIKSKLIEWIYSGAELEDRDGEI